MAILTKKRKLKHKLKPLAATTLLNDSPATKDADPLAYIVVWLIVHKYVYIGNNPTAVLHTKQPLHYQRCIFSTTTPFVKLLQQLQCDVEKTHLTSHVV